MGIHNFQDFLTQSYGKTVKGNRLGVPKIITYWQRLYWKQKQQNQTMAITWWLKNKQKVKEIKERKNFVKLHQFLQRIKNWEEIYKLWIFKKLIIFSSWNLSIIFTFKYTENKSLNYAKLMGNYKSRVDMYFFKLE